MTAPIYTVEDDEKTLHYRGESKNEALFIIRALISEDLAEGEPIKKFYLKKDGVTIWHTHQNFLEAEGLKE